MERGISCGQPALQISGAFSYVRADSSEHGGAEGETGEGDCSVFNFWRANRLPYHCVRGEPIGDSQAQALKWSDPYLGTQTHSQRHTHIWLYRGLNQMCITDTHTQRYMWNSGMNTNTHHCICSAPQHMDMGPDVYKYSFHHNSSLLFMACLLSITLYAYYISACVYEMHH